MGGFDGDVGPVLCWQYVGMGDVLAGRRVVLTGSDGTIGSAVAAHLQNVGATVIGVTVPEFDTTEPAAVDAVMEDVEFVVHLAAIPAPHLAPWPEVFADNVVSTFNVLTAAARHGVRRAVIASSINASGVPMNSHDVLPAYFPFDERLPADIDDPYSLSKSVDEQTARMVWRHWGTSVVAVRFPLTAEHKDLVEHGRSAADNPGDGVRTGWTYLDVRDAARVVELALIRPIRGVQTVFVSADETLVPYPTDDLLDRYAPGVLRLTSFVGREVPADLTRAREILGFRAQHTLDITDRPLPPEDSAANTSACV
jgi:nucleoside-diphosphate-sugar epimerase